MQQNDTPTVNMYNGNIINSSVTIYGRSLGPNPSYFFEVLVSYIMKYINVFSLGPI